MFTRARITEHALGYPMRPILVVVPIALFVGTVLALLAFIGTGDDLYYRAAMIASIAGVTAALLAALPAALALVARPADARRDGLKHATTVILTTGLFAACGMLLYRDWFSRQLGDGAWRLDAATPLAIAVAGLVALVIVGTLGYFRARLAVQLPATPRPLGHRDARLAPPISLGRRPGRPAGGCATEALARH